MLPNFEEKNPSSAFRLEGHHELFWSHEDSGRSGKRIHVGIYGKYFQTGKNGHGQRVCFLTFDNKAQCKFGYLGEDIWGDPIIEPNCPRVLNGDDIQERARGHRFLAQL